MQRWADRSEPIGLYRKHCMRARTVNVALKVMMTLNCNGGHHVITSHNSEQQKLALIIRNSSKSAGRYHQRHDNT